MLAQDMTDSGTTWIERLLMNLMSYLIVVVPVGFIVIATRRRLFRRSIQSNALIQMFVYGSTDTKAELTSNIDGDTKALLEKSVNSNAPKQAKQEPHKIKESAIEFIWCLLGLQVSYLIWGLLQEKIMTTNYPADNHSEHRSTINQSLSDSDKHLESTKRASQFLDTHHQTDLVRFHDSQFLVFINRLVAFIMAILGLVYTQVHQSKARAEKITSGVISKHAYHSPSCKKSQAPLYKYIYCSISNILSSWSQYEALKYVNFPTQCLSKSCKVVPVMLMSRIILRQRYPPSDYCCALLLALGMFIFLLGQPLDNKHHGIYNDKEPIESKSHEKVSNRNGLLNGLVILCLYLVFDSFTSNWQQSLYSQYEVSNWQMMAATNFYSILLTLTSLHQLGSLRPALELLASSRSLMKDCLAMSVMSSVGQMFVFYTIKRFGSVLFAVIMTLRQFLSILISIIVFRHPINLKSIVGLVMVFGVAAYQVYHKSKKGNRRAAANDKTTSLSEGKTSGETILIEFKK